MISYIVGTLEEISTDHIVVENNGIGYEILTYSYVIGKLPRLHSEVKIVTYVEVKEDDIRLFGFLSNQEKNLFKKLITVSGVGPKSGLSILDELGPDNLVAAIMAHDYKSISKANGVGTKTAQKVVLELSDKLDLEGTIFDTSGVSGTSGSAGSVSNSAEIENAIEGLEALGVSRSDALKAVRSIEGYEGLEAGELINAALKKLY